MRNCIVLTCLKNELIGTNRYFALFRSCGPNQTLVEMEFESPCAVGTDYELRLSGIFPGYANNGPCSSNVLSLDCAGGLKAIDTTQRKVELYEAQLK